MKSFKVPIFGQRVHFTQDRAEAQSWLDKNGHEMTISTVDGLCADGCGVLIFAKDSTPGLIAHECLHAANRILDGCGSEDHDEEVLAHLLQWLTDKCL